MRIILYELLTASVAFPCLLAVPAASCLELDKSFSVGFRKTSPVMTLPTSPTSTTLPTGCSHATSYMELCPYLACLPLLITAT
jgi:hypothetical protein